MRSIFAVPMLCAVAMTACSEHAPEDASGTDSPIIGGQVDTGDTSVVSVSGMDSASGIGWGCTGSVIATHLVLLAAHCVEDATKSTKITVSWGVHENKPTHKIRGVSFAHDPLYLKDNNIAAGHDAAVVVLKTAAPTPSLVINHTALVSSMIGSPVHVVGYGATDGQTQGGTGTRRSLDTQLMNLEQGVADIGEAGHTTCEGDSGGPTFMSIGGQTVIIGITSYGEFNCAGAGSVTRVDLSASWIDPYIAAHNGTDDGGAPHGSPPVMAVSLEGIDDEGG